MDSYVLTPLAEGEDTDSLAMDSATAQSTNAVATAEDYVQSLVTIESNWANGGSSWNIDSRNDPKCVYGYTSPGDPVLQDIICHEMPVHQDDEDDFWPNISSDLAAIRKLLEEGDADETCPSCGMPFDKGKKRKLIDSCGHERCYSCMFRNEGCPLCVNDDDSKVTKKLSADEPAYVQTTRTTRSRVKTNGHFSPYVQSRQGSQELSHSPSRLPIPNRMLETNDVMTQSCPTPPQSRRRFFLNPKTIKNQWSMRSGSRSPSDNALSVMSASTSTVTDQRRWSSVVLGKIKSLWSLRDDEGGTIKPRGSLSQRSCNSDTLYTRLGLLLSRDNNSRSFTEDVSLENINNSKPVSSNGSPVSTLTGSSETDTHKAAKEQSSDSIGSLMSMSGQSNGSASPLTRRHSVTTLQAGSVDDLSSFKSRRQSTRRSARSGTIKGPIDPKVRFAQYRVSPQQQQQQQQQQLVLKPLFFEVPQQECDPIFLGREWLVQDINNTLHSESAGVAVTGLPGTGKTALVLQLVEHSCFGRSKSNLDAPTVNGKDRPLTASQCGGVSEDVKSLASRVVAYHFCQADNNSTCLIPEFVHSVAAQLCQAPQLNMYREHVLTELNLQDSLSMRECIVDPDAAFTRGILEPLNTLSRLTNTIGADSLVIVIDGLCEAEYHRPDHGDTIASFLIKHLPKFPAWLKVIATLRTNLEDALPPLPFTKISVDVNSSTRENVIKDLMEYIGYRVTNSACIQNNLISGTPGQYKFCQHLQASCFGSFLFAKLTLDLFERGHLVAKSQSFKVLPVTLAQIYQLHFNLRFPTTSSFEKVSDILSVCLAALYPLTILEIYYSVNALHVDEFVSWEAFLQRFKLLSGLLVKRLDNTYMFFHPSFREWLIRRDDSESKKFLCDLRNGHAGIALRFSRLQAPLDSEKTLELGHHILKAHVYKNMSLHDTSSRDLQANWMASVSDSVSSALCSMRNIYAPNVKVSRLLLLSGASPDVITDLLGQAPALCVYAHEGVYDMVALLLEFGAALNVSNSQGRTPLWMAASWGHIDVVKLLIEAGASPGLTDSARRCPLVEAAKNSHFNVVAFLLGCEWKVTNPRVEIDHIDASQQALVQAAGQGVDEIVEYLLDVAEVVVDGQDSLSGETALTLAASNGRRSTVSLLLSRGAQVASPNVKSMNALVLAARDGQWEVVETLLLNGISADLVDSEQRTPLMMAASEDHSSIVELLLDNGANLSSQDRLGQTPLSWACLKGRVAVAQYLLDRGAPLDHADKSGKTALDLATLNGNPALVQLLLERGALIEHADLYGMRPLDRAISCRNIPVVQNFLRRGAKLGPTTWNMASGKPDIMLVLLNKLLEDGNTLYRKGRLKEAAYRYTYALNKFPADNELDSTFKQLQINFYLNTSRCKRKLGEVTEAVEFAEKVMQLRPTSYEAYYAKAKALKDLRRFEDALADIQEAIRLVPPGNSDIRHVLFRLKDDIANRLALDQAAYNREMAGPSYL